MLRSRSGLLRKSATLVMGLLASACMWFMANTTASGGNLSEAFPGRPRQRHSLAAEQPAPQTGGTVSAMPKTALQMIYGVGRSADTVSSLLTRAAAAPARTHLTAVSTANADPRIQLSKMLIRKCQQRPTPDEPFEKAPQGNCTACQFGCPVLNINQSKLSQGVKMGQCLLTDPVNASGECSFSTLSPDFDRYALLLSEVFKPDENLVRDRRRAKLEAERYYLKPNGADLEKVEVTNATRTFMGIENYSASLDGGGAPPGRQEEYLYGVIGMAVFTLMFGVACAVLSLFFIVARCPCCCERCQHGCWCPVFAHDRFRSCHKCFDWCCCMLGEQCCWGFPYTLCACPEAWLVHGRENNIFNGGLVIGEEGAPDARYAPDIEKIMHEMPALLTLVGTRMLARSFQLVTLPKKHSYSWCCSPACCHCHCSCCGRWWHAMCSLWPCCPCFHPRSEKHASVAVLSSAQVASMPHLEESEETHGAALMIQKQWRGQQERKFHQGLKQHMRAQSGRAPIAPRDKMLQKLKGKGANGGNAEGSHVLTPRDKNGKPIVTKVADRKNKHGLRRASSTSSGPDLRQVAIHHEFDIIPGLTPKSPAELRLLKQVAATGWSRRLKSLRTKIMQDNFILKEVRADKQWELDDKRIEQEEKEAYAVQAQGQAEEAERAAEEAALAGDEEGAQEARRLARRATSKAEGVSKKSRRKKKKRHLHSGHTQSARTCIEYFTMDQINDHIQQNKTDIQALEKLKEYQHILHDCGVDYKRDLHLLELERVGIALPPRDKKHLDFEERRWKEYLLKQQRNACCGGEYPTVQFCRCPFGDVCPDWCCCCDLGCGFCDMCIPCRRNLFDFERSRGNKPGYSRFQSRLLEFLYYAVALFWFVGLSYGAAGNRALVCGIQAIIPTVLNAAAALLEEMYYIVYALESITLSISELQQIITPGTAENAHAAFQAGVIPEAISTFIDIKLMLCDSTVLLNGITVFLASGLAIILWMGLIPVGTGMCGACFPTTIDCQCVPCLQDDESWCWTILCLPNDGLGHCETGCQRAALIAGSMCMFFLLIIAIAYLIIYPASILMGDMCLLFASIKTHGALQGFPGHAPDICGVSGKAKPFVDEAVNQMTSVLVLTCNLVASVCTGMGGFIVPKPVQPACCLTWAQDCFVTDVCMGSFSPPECCGGDAGLKRDKAKCCPVQRPLLECPNTLPLTKEDCAAANVSKPGGFRDHSQNVQNIKFFMPEETLGCPSGAFLRTQASIASPSAGSIGSLVAPSRCKAKQWWGANPVAVNFLPQYCDKDQVLQRQGVGGLEKCGLGGASFYPASAANCAYRICDALPAVSGGRTMPAITTTNGGASITTLKAVSSGEVVASAGNSYTEDHTITVTFSHSSVTDTASCQSVGSGLGTGGTAAMWAYSSGTCTKVCSWEGNSGSSPPVAAIKNDDCNRICSSQGSGALVICQQASVSIDKCQTECFHPLLRRMSKGMVKAFSLLQMTTELIFKGLKHNISGDVEGTCTYPAMCKGGAVLLALVNCKYLEIVVDNLDISICSGVAHGLDLLVDAFFLYMVTFLCAFILLIFGFKRWNEHYLEKDHHGWDSLRQTCGGKKGTIRNVDDDEMDGIDPENCCTHLYLTISAELAASRRKKPDANQIKGTISEPLMKVRKARMSILVPTRKAALELAFRRGHSRGDGIFSATRLLTAEMEAGMLKPDMPDSTIESTKSKMKKAHKHARQVFGKKASYVVDTDQTSLPKTDTAEGTGNGSGSGVTEPSSKPTSLALKLEPLASRLPTDDHHDENAYHGHRRVLSRASTKASPRSNSSERSPRSSGAKQSGSSSARGSRQSGGSRKSQVQPELNSTGSEAVPLGEAAGAVCLPSVSPQGLDPLYPMDGHQLTPRKVLPDILRNQQSGESGTTAVEEFVSPDVADHVSDDHADMTVVDLDGQHALTVEEYREASLRLREAFDMFDTDRSGTLDRSEFRDIMIGGEDNEEGTLSENQFEEVYASVDRDGDGFISFDEYIVWSLGSPPGL